MLKQKNKTFKIYNSSPSACELVHFQQVHILLWLKHLYWFYHHNSTFNIWFPFFPINQKSVREKDDERGRKEVSIKEKLWAQWLKAIKEDCKLFQIEIFTEISAKGWESWKLKAKGNFLWGESKSGLERRKLVLVKERQKEMLHPFRFDTKEDCECDCIGAISIMYWIHFHKWN